MTEKKPWFPVQKPSSNGGNRPIDRRLHPLATFEWKYTASLLFISYGKHMYTTFLEKTTIFDNNKKDGNNAPSINTPFSRRTDTLRASLTLLNSSWTTFRSTNEFPSHKKHSETSRIILCPRTQGSLRSFSSPAPISQLTYWLKFYQLYIFKKNNELTVVLKRSKAVILFIKSTDRAMHITRSLWFLFDWHSVNGVYF